MKRLLLLWLLLVALIPSSYSISVSPGAEGRDGADSIMERVRFFAPFYDGLVDDYRANLYVKGEVDVHRKNFLLRFIPSMFHLRKGERQYLIENFSDLHYSAPDLYDQKITASVGTVNKL